MSKKPSGSVLHYCPQTGQFTWVPKLGGAVKPAGSLNKKLGYLQVGHNGKRYYAHRLAWLMHYGVEPEFIDHINGDKTDNRICNLRSVAKKENHLNMACFSNSSTRVPGVSWHEQLKKWRAYITVSKRQIYLGCFTSFSEATKVRKAAEVKYGFHPNHGR